LDEQLSSKNLELQNTTPTLCLILFGNTWWAFKLAFFRQNENCRKMFAGFPFCGILQRYSVQTLIRKADKMIKKYLTIAIAIFTSLLIPTTIYANAPQGFLRVGLSSPAQGIQSNSSSLDMFFIRDGHFANMGTVTGGDTFTVTVDNSYYVFLNYAVANPISEGFSVAAQLASGRHAIPVLLESGSWGVFSGPFASETEALSHTGASVGALRAPTGRRLALYSGTQRIALFESNDFSPFFADSRGGVVNINGYDYRGFLQAHRVGGNVTPINMVHMEDYLFSVVPSEMPASWHIEALKAQAVAARSYAYTRAGVHSDRGYDLCAAVCCQVYLGMRQESERSTAAVNYTRGIFALHGGNVINAVYSSSSGGVTDDSENVWSDASPYLRSVADVHDTTGRQWSRTFTRSQLTQIAAANNSGIGDVQSVHIASVSPSGRVQRLVITGQSGQVTLEREAIRTFFSPASGGSLYSRNFRLDSFAISGLSPGAPGASSAFIIGDSGPVPLAINALNFLNSAGEIAPLTTGNVNVQNADGRRVMSPGGTAGTPAVSHNVQVTGGLSSSAYSITFVGRGWGHGVGMSQHGARGMAEAGYTFDQILKHYYTGITLTTRN